MNIRRVGVGLLASAAFAGGSPAKAETPPIKPDHHTQVHLLNQQVKSGVRYLSGRLLTQATIGPGIKPLKLNSKNPNVEVVGPGLRYVSVGAQAEYSMVPNTRPIGFMGGIFRVGHDHKIRPQNVLSLEVAEGERPKSHWVARETFIKNTRGWLLSGEFYNRDHSYDSFSEATDPEAGYTPSYSQASPDDIAAIMTTANEIVDNEEMEGPIKYIAIPFDPTAPKG